MDVESGARGPPELDDDGRIKRTDCYRHPVTGKRNYTYMDAVKVTLGSRMSVFCGMVQYSVLAGSAIGYTITTSISVVAIRRFDCFHKQGVDAPCHFSNNPSMIAFGIVQIFLSQIPNFHKLSWLSIIAAIMSFGYASIGIALSLSVVIRGNGKSTSIFGGSEGQFTAERMWNMLVALGNIALASAFAVVIFDIQDTLRSSKPENEEMKKANMIGLTTMAVFFLLCACTGYAAFGDETAGNIMTGSKIFKPLWVMYLGNVFIVVHLVGAHQVLVQPVYRMFETFAGKRWPSSSFVTRKYSLRIGKIGFSVNMLRLVWRTLFVVVTSVLAMAMPFFNHMLALLGAVGFWPVVVYFPIAMSIANQKTKKASLRWFGLQILNLSCFLVSVAAVCSAVRGLSRGLSQYKPFMYRE
ncbi:hypothetical protein L6164_015928 [Bauhinia variegata]|uniref:Uncharacterized protein n=1 Tax=Bauhinia variegata TaxID=167791 RepID=A0ACB9NM77_BAUVA|nr:hypothetical protein L6164_015928 [Bauhinia variegata]